MIDTVLFRSAIRRDLESSIATLLKEKSDITSDTDDEFWNPMVRVRQISALSSSSAQPSFTFQSPDQESIPKPVFVAAQNDVTVMPTEEPTATIMMRHVPPRLTQDQSLYEVFDLGFGGKFVFAYTSIDFRRRANRGITYISGKPP